jgi:mannitol-1-phosphate 5-dehydrogenase
MGGKNLVLFGAGMTGRGQVAQLAFEDGWSLTLVDSHAPLIRLLRETGAYTIHLIGEPPRQVTVSGYCALHTSESEAIAGAVSAADLVVTSVLEPNLPAVAETLAPALLRRLAENGRPLNIIAAENMVESSALLKSCAERHVPEGQREAFFGRFGFPSSMIARVVPVAQNPLQIYAEAYSEWTADRGAVAGVPPALHGLEWVNNQPARLVRKLYTANTAHAVCATLGWLAGYVYIHEAAQDPEIVRRFTAAIAETRAALCLEFGFAEEDLSRYGGSLAPRLASPALPDSLARVIRQPIRKLGKDERLVGPLLLCEKHGLPRGALCYGVASVLAAVAHPTRLLKEDDQFLRLRGAVLSQGPLAALQELAGYWPDPVSEAQLLESFAALT